MPKRHRESSIERIKRKIKKYQKRLDTVDDFSPIPSTTPPRPTPPFSPTPSIIIEDLETNSNIGIENITHEENKKDEDDDEIDSEILEILGKAPIENKYGPPINKHIATRWEDIIKNGLSKENKTELIKKYLTPGNCKTLEAPKLNLEAQAAVPETAVKRDKSIIFKQNQIAATLTAIGSALSALLKNKENKDLINTLNDVGKLLCDHQHQESNMRRKFIISNFESCIRESIKDVEMDQWLFGENFAEKLKAAKIIKKSGEEIKNKKNNSKPLNLRGPTNNQYKGRMNRVGPQPNFKKPTPVTQTRIPPQLRYKMPQKPFNSRN